MANGYALDNSWQDAKRRLELLEQYLDPITKRRMKSLGVSAGCRCLEVGGGGGSIARWLCDLVGSAGSVVATDINTRFLDDIAADNFEVREHDILVDPLPDRHFDFVHTRWLLHHLPTPELAIENMIGALRPGGWLLIEEVDFFPIWTSTDPAYAEFMAALTATVVKASGRDCFWARILPELAARMNLVNVGGEGDFSVIQGGSPTAQFFSLTADQMRDRMIESGAQTGEQIDAAKGLLASPDFWAFGGGGVAVWGQRPSEEASASTNA